jgi:DeoR family transcriptional regulator, aga operon transcriptional repressor
MTQILQALTEDGSVQVGALSRRLGVSEATLRRDLTLLEEQRLLTRTHGGALAQDVAHELPVRYRDGQFREAKRAASLATARRWSA